MIHYASASFWKYYDNLPKKVQLLADKSFELLKENQKHPSLHFKKIDKYYSARVGIYYRVLGVKVENDLLWFWIGNHSDYDKLIG